MVSLHKLSSRGQVSDMVARSAREIRAFVSTEDKFLEPGQYVIICHSYMQLTSANEDRTKATLAIHRYQILNILAECPSTIPIM